MSSDLRSAVYDSFTGPDLDTTKWMYLQYPMGDADPWVCCDPQSRTVIDSGRLSVEIDRFSLSNPVQIIDNCKYVLLSTQSFDVPASGTLTISADVTAEGIGTTAFDWKDGFAAMVVIDPSTGIVFDICASSHGVGAIHELLPFNPEVAPFTHLVEAPLAGVEAGTGTSHRCSITLDASNSTAVWSVDGHEIFRASKADIPASVHVGMGIFTLQPVGEGESRSLHGQGFRASWSDITISAA